MEPIENPEEKYKARMEELKQKLEEAYEQTEKKVEISEEGYIEEIPRLYFTEDERRFRRNEYMKEYLKQPESKAKRKQYHNEYRQRPEAKKNQREAYRRYLINNPQALMKSRKATREYYAKHRRNMKSISIIPNIFPDDVVVEYHHLLNDFHSEDKKCWFVVPLPKLTHNYIGGGTKDKLHWIYNAKWIEKIYVMDVKQFLLGM